MGGPIGLLLSLLMPKEVCGVTIINSLRPDGFRPIKGIKSMEDIKK